MSNCTLQTSQSANKKYKKMRAVSKGTYLILVKYLAVMEVGMREYPIDATTDRAQFGHRWLLDAHPSKTDYKQIQLVK